MSIRDKCADEVERLVGERPENYHISPRSSGYMVKVQWDEVDIEIFDVEV